MQGDLLTSVEKEKHIFMYLKKVFDNSNFYLLANFKNGQKVLL